MATRKCSDELRRAEWPNNAAGGRETTPGGVQKTVVTVIWACVYGELA